MNKLSLIKSINNLTHMKSINNLSLVKTIIEHVMCTRVLLSADSIPPHSL